MTGKIKKIIGFNGELYFDTEKPDGTIVKLADHSKPHQLGWWHSVKLEDSIEEIYKWYVDGKG